MIVPPAVAATVNRFGSGIDRTKYVSFIVKPGNSSKKPKGNRLVYDKSMVLRETKNAVSYGCN
jgi:hypothetical protein